MDNHTLKIALNFLADLIIGFLPFVLSLVLFRTTKKRNIVVWSLEFILFLVILMPPLYFLGRYLVFFVKAPRFESHFFLFTVIIPLIVFFVFYCCEIYGLCLLLLERYIRRVFRRTNWFFLLELLLNLYAAGAIYYAFNFKYSKVLPYVNKESLVPAMLAEFDGVYVFIIIFLIFMLQYYVLKMINVYFWKKLENRIFGLNPRSRVL